MSIETMVDTLFQVDDDFGMLCDVLYGPDADAEEIFNDVFGIAEISKDDHPILRRVGIAATLAGAALGVHEGIGALAGKEAQAATDAPFPKLASAAQTIKNSAPMKPVNALLKSPKRTALVAGGMLGGDLAASAALGGPNSTDDPNNPNNVSKISVAELAAGVRAAKASARRVVSGAGSAVEAKAPRTIKTVKVSGGAVASGVSGVRQGMRRVPKLGDAPAETTPIKGVYGGAQVVASHAAHPLKTIGMYPKSAAAIGVGTGAAIEHRRTTRPVRYTGQEGVYKNDFVAEGTFTKFDEDKRLAFGWASVVEKNGLPVIDRQGDYIDPTDLEEAVYRYVLNSRIGGDMHKRDGESPHHVSDLVESFVVTPEKIAKMGLPSDTPVGWWVGFKVHDDDTWSEVKKGGRTGFSIHGRGKREDVDLDQLMGV